MYHVRADRAIYHRRPMQPMTSTRLTFFSFMYRTSVQNKHIIRSSATSQHSSRQEIRSVELRVCSMQLFHLDRTSAKWRSSCPKSAAVYKISSKSDDFSLRYGDISIFKMTAVRHIGIVLPLYKTTHDRSLCCWPQLPVKFHVNLIHRSEDIAI